MKLRRKEKKWKAEGKAEAVIELLEDIDTVRMKSGKRF